MKEESGKEGEGSETRWTVAIGVIDHRSEGRLVGGGLTGDQSRDATCHLKATRFHGTHTHLYIGNYICIDYNIFKVSCIHTYYINNIHVVYYSF